MLDDNFILQSDAAVIAGILILLTVTYFLAPRSRQEVPGEFAYGALIKISKVAMIVVGIFSLSAILVVIGDIFSSYNPCTVGIYGNPCTVGIIAIASLSGKIAMIVGFGALGIGVGWTLWFWASNTSWPPITKEQVNDMIENWSKLRTDVSLEPIANIVNAGKIKLRKLPQDLQEALKNSGQIKPKKKRIRFGAN